MKSVHMPAIRHHPMSSILSLCLALLLCFVTSIASFRLTSSAPQENEQQPRPQPTFTTLQPSEASSPAPQLALPDCQLGNDTYQLGERWSPNLPPFGVQVCVLCECILRQRKNCYEAKVTCRRIINECPIIDSCPDGKKPVTTPGQCCKSCQSTSDGALMGATTTTNTYPSSTNPLPHIAHQQPSGIQPVSMALVATGPANNFSAETASTYVAPTQSQLSTTATSTSADASQEQAVTTLAPSPSPPYPFPYQVGGERAMYHKNERIKEYQAMLRDMNLCQPKHDPSDKQVSSQNQAQLNNAKPPKNSKNELNAIDTRLAFKSLHDSQNNYIPSSNSKASGSSAKNHHHKSNHNHSSHHRNTTFHNGKEPPTDQAAANGTLIVMGGLNSTNVKSPDDQQHPNDFQSTANSHSANRLNHHNYLSPQTVSSVAPIKAAAPPNTYCTLGGDTFQIGDRWNPILPPLGVQVCVQCNCIYVLRRRRTCYEAKLTCQRINHECPSIDVCPDGSQPVNVVGQCCKMCPGEMNYQAYNQVLNSQLMLTSDSSMMTQRNEKVLRDFQHASRTLSPCKIPMVAH